MLFWERRLILLLQSDVDRKEQGVTGEWNSGYLPFMPEVCQSAFTTNFTMLTNTKYRQKKQHYRQIYVAKGL